MANPKIDIGGSLDTTLVPRLLAHAVEGTVPPSWEKDRDCAVVGHAQLMDWLRSDEPPRVYGANTGVGHLDSKPVSSAAMDAFQTELLESHCLGTAPWMSHWQVRCITLARLATWRAGGGTISPELYDHVLRLAQDPEFRARIPAEASYSAGDVIPAAHWASAVVHYQRYLDRFGWQPKEALSLINGSFIHLGYQLSTLPALERALRCAIGQSRLMLELAGSVYDSSLAQKVDPLNDSLALAWEQIANKGVTESADRQQHSVSLRGAPQLIEALTTAQNWLETMLARQLQRPSDNPLVFAGDNAPISQASFLSPTVTQAAGGVLEALLFLASGIVGRCQHVLSGNVEGIPDQGVTQKHPLGLIQVPKLMMARVERMRTYASRRAFASGGVTSNGIEDLWTQGLETARIMERAIEDTLALLREELIVILWCGGEFGKPGDVPARLPEAGAPLESYCDAAAEYYAGEPYPCELLIRA